MKLISLEMTDFRQFRGIQTLHFAHGDRSVTLVYGANGTGKTTILNAFTWALYGKFTPDLEHPERPINDRVWAEAAPGSEIKAEVQLEFEHGNHRYTVRRVARARKSDGPQDVTNNEVTLDVTDESGRTTRRTGPEDALDQILPERLHQFFFFNGERIERLAQPTAYEEIEQATKTLLGLEAIERSLRHLPKVAENFEKQLRDIGSSEQQELATMLAELRSKRETELGERDQARRNAKACREDQQRVDARLRELDEVKELQRERDAREQELAEITQDIGATRDRIANLISDRGYLAFLESLSDAVQASVGELKSRGELPTPIKRTFVDELLSRQECICGTPLIPGEASHARVAEYRERAGLADVEQRWIALNSEAQHLSDDRQLLRSDIDRTLEGLDELRTRQRMVEELLSELSGKLSDFPSEEIRELEQRREKLREQHLDWVRREGAREQEIKRLDEQIKHCETELDKLDAKNREADVAKRRVHATHAATRIFEQIFDLLQDEVRIELDARIKRTFKEISFKERLPELNEAFELRLWDLTGDTRAPAAKSTGENMILSLSFVGGLASLARDQEQASDGGSAIDALLSGSGGTYPIVMDAAFGNLDEDYRQDVARALPKLAPQTVVLVSKAQASGNVEQELRSQVGRSYVIAYRTAKEGEDETIEVNGREYPYKVSTEPADERAELVEVNQ